ncbi:hypothetical protein SS50377_20443 [Spironucleus salmonicida]|uniref:Uncharacterized protein n=1 Tax=Spironucleus salmonicida TaxID=348837 RepID=V6LLS3_9EUKA|nr:hypothetical protein SS50377_20439 [Spironucleus salmonicida]KAH0577093.1 hypothetical protein SS50377_20443 [Spironucleus salmonicida]|eukprot:EST45597.1 Hypothetical protein SS50377_14444 [Spironucleus salmonicida]
MRNQLVPLPALPSRSLLAMVADLAPFVAAPPHYDPAGAPGSSEDIFASADNLATLRSLELQERIDDSLRAIRDMATTLKAAFDRLEYLDFCVRYLRRWVHRCAHQAAGPQ